MKKLDILKELKRGILFKVVIYFRLVYSFYNFNTPVGKKMNI
jgi:hypothetical protein